MFEDFETRQVDIGEASAFVRHGGQGPPVVLLHGHPRTSGTWHRVAPRLVRRGFTVVCPDLRGYGRSTGPAPTADHAGYSKRAVAGDVVAVMRALGPMPLFYVVEGWGRWMRTARAPVWVGWGQV
ncbi:alpha/beta fold hydrolase, partial [Streptomyces sp. NPDC001260]|uniref:alpha/beta fold hydrolase n=1 Tax=Streptomyces sp. NPDC001260 TaxID=3364551 RepID=UPI0036816D05